MSNVNSRFIDGFMNYLNVTQGVASSFFIKKTETMNLFLKLIESKLKPLSKTDKNSEIAYNLFNGYAYSCGAGCASLWLVLSNVSESSLSKGNDYFKRLVELDSALAKIGVSPKVAGNFVYGLLNSTGSKSNRDSFILSIMGKTKEIQKGRNTAINILDNTTKTVQSVAPQTWIPELINPITKSLTWQSWAFIGAGLTGLYLWKFKR